MCRSVAVCRSSGYLFDFFLSKEIWFYFFRTNKSSIISRILQNIIKNTITRKHAEVRHDISHWEWTWGRWRHMHKWIKSIRWIYSFRMKNTVEVRWTSIIQSIMNEFRAGPSERWRNGGRTSTITEQFIWLIFGTMLFFCFLRFVWTPKKNTQYMNLLYSISNSVVWADNAQTRHINSVRKIRKTSTDISSFFLWNINNWNDTLQTTNLESKSECTITWRRRIFKLIVDNANNNHLPKI